MKLLKEIKLSHLTQKQIVQMTTRKAVRLVIFNHQNQIAMIHAQQRNYYKLPGGGVEQGENLIQAITREAKEETGCRVKIIRELGIIKEYRTKWRQIQNDYCYLVKVVGKPKNPKFTPSEETEEFRLFWVNWSRAKNLMRRNPLKFYFCKFITLRENVLLDEVKKVLK